MKGNAMELYELGEYFECASLQEAAIPFISAMLNVENFESQVSWIQSKANPSLDETAVKFFRKHRRPLQNRGFPVNCLHERLVSELLFNAEETAPSELNEFIKSIIAIVEGAGSSEVNGEYHFAGMRNNAGSFVKRGFIQGSVVEYNLYRFEFSGQKSAWLISRTPAGMEPGTGSDRYFYKAESHQYEHLPFGQFFPYSLGDQPSPTLKFKTSTDCF